MANPQIEQFQRWLEESYAGDERFHDVTRASAAGADAGVRLEVAPGSYYEVLVRPAVPDVRVGYLTIDRALNDSLDELMEVELDDRGEPPAAMEHFFERPAFCYVTSLPLAAPEALSSPELRGRIQHLIDASYVLFQEYLA